MGSQLIEEILEKKIMDSISAKLPGTSISFSGFWQSMATGEVKKFNPPLLTVSLTPLVNEVAGAARFKTTVSIVLTIPRSVDTGCVLMVETCRELLPYINSFSGICNSAVKASFSNTETAPLYNVVGILDSSSDNSFHRESDNWVVFREFTVSLIKNT